MAQVFVNAVEGVTDADLATGATTISGPFLAGLPVITGGDYVVLTIDPDSEQGTPEVVHVTAHTSLATTATILREQEGTSMPANWAFPVKVVAPLTAAPLDTIVSDIASEAASRASADSSHASSVDHPEATTGEKGMMSAADKTVVDEVTGHVGSTSGHPGAVSGGASGFMTGTDKAELDAAVAESSTTVSQDTAQGDIVINLRKYGKVVQADLILTAPASSLPSGQQTFTSLIPAGYRPALNVEGVAGLVDGTTTQEQSCSFYFSTAGSVIKRGIAGSLSTDEVRGAFVWLTP